MCVKVGNSDTGEISTMLAARLEYKKQKDGSIEVLAYQLTGRDPGYSSVQSFDKLVKEGRFCLIRLDQNNKLQNFQPLTKISYGIVSENLEFNIFIQDPSSKQFVEVALAEGLEPKDIIGAMEEDVCQGWADRLRPSFVESIPKTKGLFARIFGK